MAGKKGMKWTTQRPPVKEKISITLSSGIIDAIKKQIADMELNMSVSEFIEYIITSSNILNFRIDK